MHQTTIPVEIHQYFRRNFHLTCHCTSLSQIHNLHQLTIPVEIPQVFHLCYHITCNRRGLSQLHHIHQVTPSGNPSSFPVPDPTAMFQKSLKKTQIYFPIVAVIIFNAPESALLHLDSLKMILQDYDSVYPADKPK